MTYILNGNLDNPIEDTAQFTNARGITYPGIWDKSTLAGMVQVVETARPDPALNTVTGSTVILVNGVPTRNWVSTPRTLADVQAVRIAAVKALLETKIAAGRLHIGNTYQIRIEDRQNFLGVAVMLARAKLNPHGGTWRNLANTEVPLTDIELGALIDSVYAYLRDLRRNATALIVSIRAQTTVAAVNALNINLGWPANT